MTQDSEQNPYYQAMGIIEQFDQPSPQDNQKELMEKFYKIKLDFGQLDGLVWDTVRKVLSGDLSRHAIGPVCFRHQRMPIAYSVWTLLKAMVITIEDPEAREDGDVYNAKLTMVELGIAGLITTENDHRGRAKQFFHLDLLSLYEANIPLRKMGFGEKGGPADILKAFVLQRDPTGDIRSQIKERRARNGSETSDGAPKEHAEDSDAQSAEEVAVAPPVAVAPGVVEGPEAVEG